MRPASSTLDSVIFYPGIPLLGDRVEVAWAVMGSLAPLSAAVGITQSPENGAIVAAVADCVGSFDIVSAAGPTQTFDLDGGTIPASAYSRVPGPPDPTLTAGEIGHFYNLTPGTHYLRAYEEDHRVVLNQALAVEAGTFTVLYGNYSVYEY